MKPANKLIFLLGTLCLAKNVYVAADGSNETLIYVSTEPPSSSLSNDFLTNTTSKTNHNSSSPPSQFKWNDQLTLQLISLVNNIMQANNDNEAMENFNFTTNDDESGMDWLKIYKLSLGPLQVVLLLGLYCFVRAVVMRPLARIDRALDNLWSMRNTHEMRPLL